MKRRTRALIATLLILCTFISLVPSAAAAGEPPTVQPLMDIIVYSSCQLSISDGIATIECSARGTPGKTDKIQLTIELQQLQSSWTTINTYYVTSYTNYASFYKEVPVAKGYFYRIKLTIKMWHDTNTETKVMYSKSVYAKP